MNSNKNILELVFTKIKSIFNENRSLKTINKIINNKQFSNQLSASADISKKVYNKKIKDKNKEKDKK